MQEDVGAGGCDDSGEESSSTTGSVVTLDRHQRAVGDRAAEIAARLGMPDGTRATLRLAGLMHDLGKADLRFQTLLHRGDRHAAEAAREPLAKSGIPYRDQAARRGALRASGWPRGMRHEAVSAEFVRHLLTTDSLGAEIDRELLVHLVASHHGWGRPLSKPVSDPAPRPVRATIPEIGRELEVSGEAGLVDWEAPVRFAALCRRYGHWGLALLEAVLRLADIACSEEGT